MSRPRSEFTKKDLHTRKEKAGVCTCTAQLSGVFVWYGHIPVVKS